MTPKEIDKLEAGPELDALVAEHVMGWRWAVAECEAPSLNDGRCQKPNGAFVLNFKPSRDIAAAWQAVEKFNNYDWKLESHGEGETFTIYKDGTHYSGDGAGAPLAICRAALKAMLTSSSR